MSLVLPGVSVRQQRAMSDKAPVEAHVLPASSLVDPHQDIGPKVTVKHTFINVEDEESPVPDAHRGAKTCLARYSDSNVSFTPLHRDDYDGADEEHYEQGSQQPMASSAGSRGASLSLCLSDDGELKYASGSSPLEQRCYSPAKSEAFPPPPSYAAPATFDEEDQPTPPPVVPPGTSQVSFLDASHVQFGGHSPANGNDADDLEVNGAAAATTLSGEARVTVKNTFIDIEGDRPNYDDRNTRTCMARLSEPPASFPSTPIVGLAGDAVVSNQQQGSPSVGSQSHGTLGPDGHPVCQPCAWFYKDTGCHNKASCRYCHLCPQGELKNRKKLKIARLRNQEGDTAAANGNNGG